MTVVLALPKLYADVAALMAADAAALIPPATSPTQYFGWREPAKRKGARRIVWVPGNDAGDLGKLLPAKHPGQNPRPLATLGELFTVYLEGQDPSAPENELAQYQQTRLLFDAWVRAAYLVARGTFEIVSAAWVIDKKERRFGTAIKIVGTVQAMIPDAPLEAAPAETGAAIATSELSVTETTLVRAPVLVATTAAIVLSGVQTIDGVDVEATDRVLVKNQAAGEDNGIYVAAVGAWVRALDADTSGEVPSGLLVSVHDGDENHEATFVLTTPAPITLGTTPLTFARVQP